MSGASSPEQMAKMADLFQKYGPKTPEDVAQAAKEKLLAQQGTQEMAKTREEGASKERVAKMELEAREKALQAQHDLADKAILDRFILEGQTAGTPRSESEIADMVGKIKGAGRRFARTATSWSGRHRRLESRPRCRWRPTSSWATLWRQPSRPLRGG